MPRTPGKSNTRHELEGTLSEENGVRFEGRRRPRCGVALPRRDEGADEAAGSSR
jgi:hypothetical protein